MTHNLFLQLRSKQQSSRAKRGGISREFLEDGELSDGLDDGVDDEDLIEEGDVGALRARGGSKAALKRRRRRMLMEREQEREDRIEAARQRASRADADDEGDGAADTAHVAPKKRRKALADSSDEE